MARICPTQSWRWEAVANGVGSFLLGFPSMEDLMRVDGLELGVPGQASKLVISQWKQEEIPHKLELTQVWVHVTGIPYTLRHFLGLWAVGTLLGATLDIDLFTLRRRGIVHMLVGMISGDVFNKERDAQGPFVRTEGVLKLKGYEFTFRPEPAGFIPDVGFTDRKSVV